MQEQETAARQHEYVLVIRQVRRQEHDNENLAEFRGLYLERAKDQPVAAAANLSSQKQWCTEDNQAADSHKIGVLDKR